MYEIENQNGFDELYHHGIKGMRWGVRRTPEQLGHRTEYVKNKRPKNARIDGYQSSDRPKNVRYSKQGKIKKEGRIRDQVGYDKTTKFLDVLSEMPKITKENRNSREVKERSNRLDKAYKDMIDYHKERRKSKKRGDKKT